MIHRYILIGSGAAGISAAEAIRQQDSRADILPISDEASGYYSRPGLAYYLTGELSEQQLYPFSDRDYRRLNIRPLHARVVRIDPPEHQVELQDGSKLPYDRLLIATGSSAVRLQVPGAELEGVVKLDTLDDARHVLKLARKSRAAIVTGGGITALEFVEGLRARGVTTHYFLRKDRYWANVLDETESRIIEHRLSAEGVQIHFHTDLAEVLGKHSRVVGVRTQDGRQIACGMVAVAIGVKPRLELAKASGLEIDRGIIVNAYLQTSDPDIYAAGDVAQVYDPLTGKSVLDTLWTPAREQGRNAGLNMTGQRIPFKKPVAFNVTRLGGLTTTLIGMVGQGRDDDLIGIARGDSEIWRELPDAIAAQDCFDVNRLRVLLAEKTMLGAVVMGDQTLSRALQVLVAEQVDISSIRSELLQPDAPIAEIIAAFWTRWLSTQGEPTKPVIPQVERPAIERQPGRS